MYNKSFPKCKINGSLNPINYNYFFSGKIPEKCSTCKFFYHGGCLRNFNETEEYLHLDYGPCPISGDTEPKLIDNQYISSKVYIPKKCLDCPDLSYSYLKNLYCNNESDTWGFFNRNFDWGRWKPNLTEKEIELNKILKEYNLSDDFLLLLTKKKISCAITQFKILHQNYKTIEIKKILDKINKLIK